MHESIAKHFPEYATLPIVQIQISPYGKLDTGIVRGFIPQFQLGDDAAYVKWNRDHQRGKCPITVWQFTELFYSAAIPAFKQFY